MQQLASNNGVLINRDWNDIDQGTRPCAQMNALLSQVCAYAPQFCSNKMHYTVLHNKLAGLHLRIGIILNRLVNLLLQHSSAPTTHVHIVYSNSNDTDVRPHKVQTQHYIMC